MKVCIRIILCIVIVNELMNIIVYGLDLFLYLCLM